MPWRVSPGNAAFAVTTLPAARCAPRPSQHESRRAFAKHQRGLDNDPRKVIDPRFELRYRNKREFAEASPETLMQSQMYTPEVLKSEGLSTNCIRMVQFGLHVPELLDRYAARAAELAPGMRPAEFARILRSFAMAQYRHEELLKTFSKFLTPRLHDFMPVQLTSTCNAFAKLRERDSALFRRLSAEMPHKLPLFEFHQLGHVANAYARLSIRDPLLFDDIADEVVRRPEEFDAIALMLIANAFSHFRLRPPRLWGTLADWLLVSYVDLSAKDVGVVLNALSSVGFHHDALLRTLAVSLCHEPLLGQLEPSVLCVVLNALARLHWAGVGHEDVFAVLADRVVRYLGEFEGRQVTQLLHACTRLKPLVGHEMLLDGILSRSLELVPDLSAQSLSVLAHSCGTLMKRDVPLLTRVAKAVPQRIKEFTPQGLAMLASGFSRLGVRSEILFYLLAQEVVVKMPLFTGQGIGMMLRAFGRLEINNERLLLACRKQVRALADELTLSEIESVEEGFRSFGALDGATDAVLRKARNARQASGSLHQDRWVQEEERLLRKLAEEPATPAAAPWHRKYMEVEEPREVAGGQSQEKDPWQPGSPELVGPPRQADERPDLWELWSEEGSRAQSVERSGGEEIDDSDDATPASRLKEYLARPQRLGRRPIVLSTKDQRDAPTSPVTQTGQVDDLFGEHETVEREVRAGRKHRRGQR